eukprot:TRINITY_DN7325_c0_g1_i1.p1 TRINITY_DN7325_c0_g1~~TRINITY_DN7325_c0_g1_i1.p1  ORF type:complete len:1964 (+),score=384.96 TRINITY_DN7325_c0_g1_i1:53-5944(+)
MEVLLNEWEGIPKNCMISIRAGHVRKQAFLEHAPGPKSCLKFAAEGPVGKDLHVDILAVIGKAHVRTCRSKSTYSLEFESFAKQQPVPSSMRCAARVHRVDGLAHFSPPTLAASLRPGPAETPKRHEKIGSAPVLKNSPSRRHLSTISSQKYMESYDLVPLLQQILTSTVSARPQDPFSHLAEQLHDIAAAQPHDLAPKSGHAQALEHPQAQMTHQEEVNMKTPPPMSRLAPVASLTKLPSLVPAATPESSDYFARKASTPSLHISHAGQATRLELEPRRLWPESAEDARGEHSEEIQDPSKGDGAQCKTVEEHEQGEPKSLISEEEPEAMPSPLMNSRIKAVEPLVFHVSPENVEPARPDKQWQPQEEPFDVRNEKNVDDHENEATACGSEVAEQGLSPMPHQLPETNERPGDEAGNLGRPETTGSRLSPLPPGTPARAQRLTSQVSNCSGDDIEENKGTAMSQDMPSDDDIDSSQEQAAVALLRAAGGGSLEAASSQGVCEEDQEAAEAMQAIAGSVLEEAFNSFSTGTICASRSLGLHDEERCPSIISTPSTTHMQSAPIDFCSWLMTEIRNDKQQSQEHVDIKEGMDELTSRSSLSRIFSDALSCEAGAVRVTAAQTASEAVGMTTQIDSHGSVEMQECQATSPSERPYMTSTLTTLPGQELEAVAATACASRPIHATILDGQPEGADDFAKQFVSASFQAAAIEAATRPEELRAHCSVEDENSNGDAPRHLRFVQKMESVAAAACAKEPSHATIMDEQPESVDASAKPFVSSSLDAAATTATSIKQLNDHNTVASSDEQSDIADASSKNLASASLQAAATEAASRHLLATGLEAVATAACVKQHSRATTIDEQPEGADTLASHFVSDSLQAAATLAASRPNQMRSHSINGDQNCNDDAPTRYLRATGLEAVTATACDKQPSRTTSIDEQPESVVVSAKPFASASLEAAATIVASTPLQLHNPSIVDDHDNIGEASRRCILTQECAAAGAAACARQPSCATTLVEQPEPEGADSLTNNFVSASLQAAATEAASTPKQFRSHSINGDLNSNDDTSTRHLLATDLQAVAATAWVKQPSSANAIDEQPKSVTASARLFASASLEAAATIVACTPQRSRDPSIVQDTDDFGEASTRRISANQCAAAVAAACARQPSRATTLDDQPEGADALATHFVSASLQVAAIEAVSGRRQLYDHFDVVYNDSNDEASTRRPFATDLEAAATTVCVRQPSHATTAVEQPESAYASGKAFAFASLEAAATEAATAPTQSRNDSIVEGNDSVDENDTQPVFAAELQAVAATDSANWPSHTGMVDDLSEHPDAVTKMLASASLETAARQVVSLPKQTADYCVAGDGESNDEASTRRLFPTGLKAGTASACQLSSATSMDEQPGHAETAVRMFVSASLEVAAAEAASTSKHLDGHCSVENQSVVGRGPSQHVAARELKSIATSVLPRVHQASRVSSLEEECGSVGQAQQGLADETTILASQSVGALAAEAVSSLRQVSCHSSQQDHDSMDQASLVAEMEKAVAVKMGNLTSNSSSASSSAEYCGSTEAAAKPWWLSRSLEAAAGVGGGGAAAAATEPMPLSKRASVDSSSETHGSVQEAACARVVLTELKAMQAHTPCSNEPSCISTIEEQQSHAGSAEKVTARLTQPASAILVRSLPQASDYGSLDDQGYVDEDAVTAAVDTEMLHLSSMFSSCVNHVDAGTKPLASRSSETAAGDVSRFQQTSQVDCHSSGDDTARQLLSGKDLEPVAARDSPGSHVSHASTLEDECASAVAVAKPWWLSGSIESAVAEVVSPLRETSHHSTLEDQGSCEASDQQLVAAELRDLSARVGLSARQPSHTSTLPSCVSMLEGGQGSGDAVIKPEAAKSEDSIGKVLAATELEIVTGHVLASTEINAEEDTEEMLVASELISWTILEGQDCNALNSAALGTISEDAPFAHPEMLLLSHVPLYQILE